MIQSHVADQEGIVGSHHGCGNLEDWQFEFGPLAIDHQELFHEQGHKPGADAAPRAVEDEQVS